MGKSLSYSAVATMREVAARLRVCCFGALFFVFLLQGGMASAQGVDDVPLLGDAIGRVKSHIYADPLSVSGQLGSTLTASWNNTDLHHTAPFSLTAYGNFNINIYGFSIPININFLDVSATTFTFRGPRSPSTPRRRGSAGRCTWARAT